MRAPRPTLNPQRTARVLAAAFVAVSGYIHYDLWVGGYQGIRYIGPLFLVNVAASAVAAIGLVVTRDFRVSLAAIGLTLGTLVSLVLSRTTGLVGFMESAWTTDALAIVAAGVGALVAVAVVQFGGTRRLELIPARVRSAANSR